MEKETELKRLERGLFIVFEGIDGSGKSTQCSRLRDSFVIKGIDAILTREPTDGPWGKKIREIAAAGRDGISPEEEMEIFVRDREQHVSEVIRPALDAGRVVVCDRYYYSTIAYQGALGLDAEEIRRQNEDIQKFPKPDLVIYLDLEPWQGVGRISEHRDGGANVGYEKEDFLKKVKQNFEAMDYDNFVKVEAMGCQRAIAKTISEIVRDRLGVDLTATGFSDVSCRN